MPTSLAGSRGGIISTTSNSKIQSLFEKLFVGSTSLESLSSALSSVNAPQNVTLVINNSCPLNCPHCYLQVDKHMGKYLSQVEWELLIQSILRQEPELLCFSGKEVFSKLGPRLLVAARHLIRDWHLRTRLGVITNGILLNQFRPEIMQAKPDYFDISIDGVEIDNDAIRGFGSYSKALPNILWASAEFRERFFITLTVQKVNKNRLFDAIELYQSMGIQNVSLGFYRPLPYTSKTIALSQQEMQMVLEHLSTLNQLDTNQPLRVMADIDLTNMKLVNAFLHSSWFDLSRIKEDSNGELYIEDKFENGIVLQLRFMLLPAGIWRSVRITPEGLYLAAEDTIDASQYWNFSIGNVRDFHFDFSSIHQFALNSKRFNTIFSDYFYNILPQLVEQIRIKRVAA